MSDMYTIKFFGWCSEDGHDKVWGYVVTGDNLYNFWGRRGKSFTFKHHGDADWDTNYALKRKAEQKCRSRPNGTYRSVPVYDIEKICQWPDFKKEFERQLVFAKLASYSGDF